MCMKYKGPVGSDLVIKGTDSEICPAIMGYFW